MNDLKQSNQKYFKFTRNYYFSTNFFKWDVECKMLTLTEVQTSEIIFYI